MFVDEYSAHALLKNIRVSPQKLNLVAQMIRGQKVDKAMNMLKFSKKRVATEVLKTLRSAVANAENNHGLDIDSLFVAEAFVGKGACMKRFHPRGRSKGGVVRKLFSNLRVVVTEIGNFDIEENDDIITPNDITQSNDTVIVDNTDNVTEQKEGN